MDLRSALSDSSRAVVDMAAEAIGNNPEYFKLAINLTFEDNYPLSMRSARVVQVCCEKYPKLLLPYIEEIVDKLISFKVEGVKRSLLKLFRDSINLKELKQSGQLACICFDLLINPKQGIAARNYSLDILLKIAEFEPDLKTEIISIVENMLYEDSVGLRNKAGRLLKKHNRYQGSVVR